MPAARRSTRRGARATGRSPRRGRRAEHKAATERRIVAAALGLFQARGFDATTTRAIAKKAGIAEGTVFNYFRTKEDIALHFFEQEVEEAMATVSRNPRLRKAPLEEKLFALIQRQLELLLPYERFIGNAVLEVLKPASKLGLFSHRAAALRHRYLGFVQTLIEESLPKKSAVPLPWWVPDAFWLFYMVVLLFWLSDASPGKQHTLAFLDRSLEWGVGMLRRGR
jgi:AcrR family transcriptional regulator